MNKVIIIFLILGMLLIGFFTYQTHVRSLQAQKKDSDLDRALAAYDYVNLQIKDAYQQALLFNFTVTDVEDYFESEDLIYHKISEIDSLTSAFPDLNVPSDTLRPMVSRQFLKMESFRIQERELSDSSAMLSELRKSQEQIGRIIISDKEKIQGAFKSIYRSGMITPLFIFFLFAFGAGSFAYAYTTLGQTRKDIAGIEEKLRKNQEILNSEIEAHEMLKVTQEKLLEISDEIWILLEASFQQGEVVDFKVQSANKAAQVHMKLEDPISFEKVLKHSFGADNAAELMNWLLDGYESQKSSVIDLNHMPEDHHIRFYAHPTESGMYLRGSDLTKVRKLEDTELTYEHEADILFEIDLCIVAELDPQGKVRRGNRMLKKQDENPEGKYIWEILFPGDAGLKREIRNAIHGLSESKTREIAASFRLFGILGSNNLIQRVIFITHSIEE